LRLGKGLKALAMADLQLLRHHSPEKHHKISKNPWASWIRAVWLLNTSVVCLYGARGTVADDVTVLVLEQYSSAAMPRH